MSPATYKDLSRHTRVVVASRWSLWGLIAFLVIALIWVAADDNGGEGARLVFSASKPQQAEQNVMQQPRYQGLDNRNQPYVVVADKAIQQDKNTVLLYNIRADMNQNDGTWLALNSTEGTLQTDKESLYLSKGVQLFYEGGYEMNTEDAYVDVQAGSAYGNTPVTGQSPMGTLEADSFAVKDKGRLIEFNGSVRMKLYP